MELLLLAFALAYLAVYRGGVGTYCAITKTEPPWVRNRRERLVNHETVKGRRAVAVESNRTMRGFLGRLWGNLWEDANRLAAERRAEHQAWALNGGPRPPVWRRIATWWAHVQHAGNQQPEPASNDTDTATESWDVCLHPVERPDGELGSCGWRYFYTVDPDTNGRSVFDCGRHLLLEPVQPPPVMPGPAPTPLPPEVQPQAEDATKPAPQPAAAAKVSAAACPWIPPATAPKVCGADTYLDSPYCVGHYVIGKLTECQWASGNSDIPQCPNERVQHTPFCEQHSAEFTARTATVPKDSAPVPTGTTEPAEATAVCTWTAWSSGIECGNVYRPTAGQVTCGQHSTSTTSASDEQLATVTPIRNTNREDSPVSSPTTPTATTEVATVQTVEGFAASVVKSGSQEWPATLEQARTDITASGLNNDPAVLAAISQMDEAAAQLAAAGQALDAALANGHKQTAEQVSGMGGRAADKTTTYQNQ